MCPAGFPLYLGVPTRAREGTSLGDGGGWNKTHGTIECHICLSSFLVAKLPEGEHALRWENGSELMAQREAETLILRYRCGDERIREAVGLSFVDNGFGGNPRTYFFCPYCGKRVCKLYLKDQRFQCRACAKLNYRSQQVTKGWSQEVLKMERILKKEFGIDTRGLTPMDMVSLIPRRPKGMRWEAYLAAFRQLQAAQIRYQKAFVKMACWFMGW